MSSCQDSHIRACCAHAKACTYNLACNHSPTMSRSLHSTLSAADAAATALLDTARMAATAQAGLKAMCWRRCRMMLHVCCAGLLGVCRGGSAAPTLHVKQVKPHHHWTTSVVPISSCNALGEPRTCKGVAAVHVVPLSCPKLYAQSLLLVNVKLRRNRVPFDAAHKQTDD